MSNKPAKNATNKEAPSNNQWFKRAFVISLIIALAISALAIWPLIDNSRLARFNIFFAAASEASKTFDTFAAAAWAIFFSISHF